MIFLASEIGSLFTQFGIQTFGSYELFGLIIIILVFIFMLLMNMPLAFTISAVAFTSLALFITGYGLVINQIFVLIIIIIAIIIALFFWKTLLGE